jgi:hypothetical protein
MSEESPWRVALAQPPLDPVPAVNIPQVLEAILSVLTQQMLSDVLKTSRLAPRLNWYGLLQEQETGGAEEGRSQLLSCIRLAYSNHPIVAVSH